jgi:hypothetical protein
VRATSMAESTRFLRGVLSLPLYLRTFAPMSRILHQLARKSPLLLKHLFPWVCSHVSDTVRMKLQNPHKTLQKDGKPEVICVWRLFECGALNGGHGHDFTHPPTLCRGCGYLFILMGLSA